MSGRRRTWLAVTVAALALGLPSVASARLAQGFAGVVIDGPVWPAASQVDLAHQLDVMVADGVENLRFEIDWATVEPYQTWNDVPAAQRAQFTDVDGLPLDLGALDQLVGLASQRGLSLRPVVLNAPSWDAVAPAGAVASTPKQFGPYGTFLSALIHRYGPRGSFWRTHAPKLPIRMWQIWNEPNLIGYWATQPTFEPTYVALLKVAHDAIKRADPGAEVVLAGMVNVSWEFLARIYQIRGARNLFDVVAVHPYTHSPSGVLKILHLVRQAMDRGGDRTKPLMADEIGWNSSVGKSPDHFGIEVTEAGQAADTDRTIRAIVAQRSQLGLIGFDYYDWTGIETPGSYEFNFAGLFRLEGSRFVAKPVLARYRHDVLGYERCAVKSRVATRCAKPS